MAKQQKATPDMVANGKEVPQVPQQSAIAKRESEILAFWQERTIFEKTLSKDAPKGEFTFYDGPPFATGLPHFGHILPTTMKDAIPRYKTMQGYHVVRRWGWDCHGLPIENLVEKELGLKNKREIENYGIDKFNKAARESVLRYYSDWKRIIPRLGRFVDMDNYYMTMDTSFTESVWWSFKTLHEKGLVYEGYRAMQMCPHCGTTLSNFEVNQGYKDITDISVYVKFALTDEPNTYFLAWTTTPWTLPGNFALAVNPEVTYVKIKVGEALIILAEPRLSVVKEEYTIVSKHAGSELVGKSYQPLFPYYVNAQLPNKENAWKVYGAEFVTTTDGSGIVHIAPGFGEDDLQLAQKNSIPFVQHVNADGQFKPEVTEFAGQDVKPKDDHQKADVEIIKYLAAAGALFAKEKLIHSYPHCWRCGTPLLNYASSSWFVKVSAIKDRLVANNQTVSWVPGDLKDGRFGNWLEGARDWGVSRQRYWGTSMPIWRSEDGTKIEMLGSVEELKAKVKSPNMFFFMRHGQGQHNVLNQISSKVDNPHHLTEQGKAQVLESAEKLKGEKIDVIYASDFVRTRETAELVANAIGYPVDKIIYDTRLREVNMGVFDGKTADEYHAYFKTHEERFTKTPEGGENADDVRKRVAGFLLEVDAKYEGKNILTVSHDDPTFFMRAVSLGLTRKEILKLPANDNDYLGVGQFKKHHHYRLPRNENFELDLHRPYIDSVTWKDAEGRTYKRILDVFDTWYDSGSMPYAQNHYPFDKSVVDLATGKGFPADFIAEGLDQTRGWFYVLLVLGTALFDKAPYKNVIVNGLILAEDGKKMSKSLKNYPDLMVTVEKYCADALRYFLISSPAVKAEDVRFSEAGLDEVVKKIILRLNNVHSFYALYAGEGENAPVAHAKSTQALDRWILARLAQTAEDMTKGFESYQLDKASRPLEGFIDDLSTWYLRRSRDRFKGEDLADKQAALSTLRFVFENLAKLMAPVMPFTAEDLFLKVKTANAPESVHLETWPVLGTPDSAMLDAMQAARKIVEQSLALRAKSGIKVRQPLGALTVKNATVATDTALAAIIADEVNVKTVSVNAAQADDVVLDTTLTPALLEEGKARDIIRAIQELRKEAKLEPQDSIAVTYTVSEGGKSLLERYQSEISKKTQVVAWKSVETLEEGAVIDAELNLKVTIAKV